MPDALYVVALLGFFIAGAWISQRLTLRSAYTGRRAALERLEASHEAKLAEADDRNARLVNALERLEWAITAPASDAVQLDAALTDTRVVIEAAHQPVGGRI